MTETIPSDVSTDQKVSGVEIVLESVTKRYPGQKAAAVDNVSLTVPAGEIVVFVGPSGCGKTTTMRMINRLIEPTSGKITIDGKDALRATAKDFHVKKPGLVFRVGGKDGAEALIDNVKVWALE